MSALDILMKEAAKLNEAERKELIAIARGMCIARELSASKKRSAEKRKESEL